MPNNGNVTSDSHVKVLTVDLGEQFDLYDRLPARWKQIVDSLPVKQDLREVEAIRARFGDKEGFDLIVKTYQQQYPGWSFRL
jgi:hypothetical protein